MRLVRPTEVGLPCNIKSLPCPTPRKRRFDRIGLFRGMSNREYPPPEMETAAPVGAGNGDQIGKQASNSKSEEYSIEALAARFPIIATHVGFDDMEALA